MAAFERAMGGGGGSIGGSSGGGGDLGVATAAGGPLRHPNLLAVLGAVALARPIVVVE